MKLNRRFIRFEATLLALVITCSASVNLLRADTGSCGASVTLPFNDILNSQSAGFFCQIAEAFFSGLTNGTSATTYSPDATVTRGQMAAFISRTLEQSIRRNNRRAVSEKWALPPNATGITLTTVGDQPLAVEFDGTDLWVANNSSQSVQRVRPSDGKLLETWTGATNVFQLVMGAGRIFATGKANPGRLYSIDPAQAPGAVSVLLSSLPANPNGIAFDGTRLWTANGAGSVSRIMLSPVSATNVSAGFSTPFGILHDGNNIWVTDTTHNSLLKLDNDGNIVQSIQVGSNPRHPVFDGINIWVPSLGNNSVTVVRVKDSQGNPLASAFALATLTGNGLTGPETCAFDGERILVTNSNSNSVSLFKAADLSPLGSISTGAGSVPSGACSDGLNFWVTLQGTDRLARL